MKYLLCADGSPSSKKALQMVVQFCKPEDELIVLSVGDPEYEILAGKSEKDVLLVHKYKEKHDQVVQEAVNFATQHGIQNTHSYIVYGDPREEIISNAEKYEVDTIVMGSRGLGALKRLLVGSVSDYVLKNANCNVLITKIDS